MGDGVPWDRLPMIVPWDEETLRRQAQRKKNPEPDQPPEVVDPEDPLFVNPFTQEP